jgi:pullulanase/glycogen debranching enzyme
VMINAHWEPMQFQIREGKTGQWKCVVDTGRRSPEDITERPVNALEYNIGPRSVVILEEQ